LNDDRHLFDGYLVGWLVGWYLMAVLAQIGYIVPLALKYSFCRVRGTGHQRADKRHGNPPQGKLELLVVSDKVERPPGELGVCKSMECNIFPSML